MEAAIDYLLDSIANNNATGSEVHGAVCLHVDDLCMAGDEVFRKAVTDAIKRDFAVGSETLMIYHVRGPETCLGGCHSIHSCAYLCKTKISRLRQLRKLPLARSSKMSSPVPLSSTLLLEVS